MYIHINYLWLSFLSG